MTRLPAKPTPIPRINEAEEGFATLIRWEGLPTPVREHRFDGSRRWRFDFAWPEHRVAVEIEGGIWTQGAHVRGRHFESDVAKYAEAGIAGWLVLRVTPEMCEQHDGRAIGWLKRALAARSEGRA